MSRLHVVCWKWKSPTYRTPYTAHHVNVLGAMLDRNLRTEHRLVCVTDDAAGIDHETHPLWDDCGELHNPNGPEFPSCYRRLKLFSPETQRAMGIVEGDRVLSIDLDVVVVGDMVPLVDRDEDFVGWRGVGRQQPVVYNGTIFLFRAGTMEHLWTEFDPAMSPQRTRASLYFGSDQGWLSYKLAGRAPGWDEKTGVYSYARDMWFMSPNEGPPRNAIVISFNGRRKPWDPAVQDESPWITQHWRM